MNSNYNVLVKSLFDVYAEQRKILFSLPPNYTTTTIKAIPIDALEDFFDSLKKFYNELSKIQKNHILIQGFLDRQYGEISKLKHFILELTQSDQSRKMHDKIFMKIFHMDKHVPLGVTLVFEEFIKGITYFSFEDENKKKIPIYHRAASCGNSSADFRMRYLRCYNHNIPKDKEKKKKHIRKCFLERIIFDDMFKKLTLHFPSNFEHQEHLQNEGHQFQLTERANNFNSCYLGIRMRITIEYDNLYPDTLIIEYLDGDNVIEKETYVKTTYIDEYGNTRYYDYAYHYVYEDGELKEYVSTF